MAKGFHLYVMAWVRIFVFDLTACYLLLNLFSDIGSAELF